MHISYPRSISGSDKIHPYAHRKNQAAHTYTLMTSFLSVPAVFPWAGFQKIHGPAGTGRHILGWDHQSRKQFFLTVIIPIKCPCGHACGFDDIAQEGSLNPLFHKVCFGRCMNQLQCTFFLLAHSASRPSITMLYSAVMLSFMQIVLSRK